MTTEEIDRLEEERKKILEAFRDLRAHADRLEQLLDRVEERLLRALDEREGWLMPGREG
jgi:transcription elongation GreA/GreB family factor